MKEFFINLYRNIFSVIASLMCVSFLFNVAHFNIVFNYRYYFSIVFVLSIIGLIRKEDKILCVIPMIISGFILFSRIMFMQIQTGDDIASALNEIADAIKDLRD